MQYIDQWSREERAGPKEFNNWLDLTFIFFNYYLSYVVPLEFFVMKYYSFFSKFKLKFIIYILHSFNNSKILRCLYSEIIFW